MPGFEWGPSGLANDVTLMAGAIVAITGFVRAKHWASLDGIAVNIFAFALGLVMGGGLFVGKRFDTLLGGLAHGLQAGVLAWVLVEGTRKALKTNKPVGFLAAPQNGVQAFILETVKAAVRGVQLPATLAAVAPLLAQFAQSEVILADELRLKLQAQILTVLRKAGLAGVNLQ